MRYVNLSRGIEDIATAEAAGGQCPDREARFIVTWWAANSRTTTTTSPQEFFYRSKETCYCA